MAISREERASKQTTDISFTERETLENYRKAVNNVFVGHYHKLNLLLGGSMKSFAEKALQAKLISFETMKDANFENIFSEFKAGLEWKSTISEIKRHFQRFIDILVDIGGPPEEAGKDLAAKLHLAGM